MTTYHQLYNDHPTTLQCPCSQFSVPYQSFLTVSFVLHQVCSSDFVSPVWLSYLASFDPILVPSWTETDASRDFRVAGVFYFQLLATFCSLVRTNIAQAQSVFNNTQFINDRVLASPIFVQQTEAIVLSFTESTRNDFVRAFNWIKFTLMNSQFLTGTNINSHFTVSADDQVKLEGAKYSVIASYDGSFSLVGECSCVMDFAQCKLPLFVYINGSYWTDFIQWFTDLSIGCLPLKGFLDSSILWWYNATNLKNIQETYSTIIHSQHMPNITSLNASVPTRFENISMSQLLDGMLVESYTNNNSRFDQFYSACAPVTCSYTVARRRDIIVILLLLVSICGGINRGLRILVPLIGTLLFFSVDYWNNRYAEHRK